MGKKHNKAASGWDFGDDDIVSGAPYAKGSFKKCYEDHPKILMGGGAFIGGSCSHPVVENADVYIGFDHGMMPRKFLPWDEKQPVQIFYPITDMSVPQNAETFKKLVQWTVEQLAAGKTVHAGCIGGHGRTGMFLAAVYRVVKDDVDAIEKVRNLYCKKAVESDAQVRFLNEHFGITKVQGYKDKNLYVPSTTSVPKTSGASSPAWGQKVPDPVKKATGWSSGPIKTGSKELPAPAPWDMGKQKTLFSGAKETFKAIPSKSDIFGVLV